MSAEVLQKIEKHFGFELPKSYVKFMEKTESLQIESDFNYMDLWPLDSLIQFNRECESQDYIPNFIILGTDGGGTALIMNKEKGNIFFTEMIGMSEQELSFVANNFSEFMDRFKKEEIEIF